MTSDKNHRSIGDAGEEHALRFLQEKGYTLCQQNFCVLGGEIDLVMKEKDTWVFVEVKTRKQGAFGSPEESITPQKLKFLQRAVEQFFLKKNLSVYQESFRMDLVAIQNSAFAGMCIRHYENAFYFDDFEW